MERNNFIAKSKYESLAINIFLKEKMYMKYEKTSIVNHLKKMKNGDVLAFREVPIYEISGKSRIYSVNPYTYTHFIEPRIKRSSDVRVAIPEMPDFVNPNILIADFIIAKKENNTISFSMIEIDGDYHFYNTRKNMLGKQLANDIAKRVYCEQNNVDFYDIPVADNLNIIIFENHLSKIIAQIKKSH